MASPPPPSEGDPPSAKPGENPSPALNSSPAAPNSASEAPPSNNAAPPEDETPVVRGPPPRVRADSTEELHILGDRTAVMAAGDAQRPIPDFRTNAEVRMYIEDVLVDRAKREFAQFHLSDASLRLLAAETTQKFRLELDVNIEIDASVDPDARLLPAPEISRRVNLASFRFQQFLDRLKNIEDERLLESKASSRRFAAAEKEATKLDNMAKQKSAAGLDSSGVPADLVKNMLEVGFEEHLKLIRRILFGDESEKAYGVTVAFKDLTVAQDARYSELKSSGFRPPTGPDSIGTSSVNLACGLCFAMHSARLSCESQAHARAESASASVVKPKIERLKGVSGVFRPGEMALLLGPPRAGKTQLLHAISDKTTEVGARRVTGDVWYNGHPVKSVHAPNFCTVVDQTDVHIPTLTVRETLEFAHRCRGVPGKTLKERTKNVEALHKVARNRVDLVMAVLGLTRVADTVVGNDVLKGISGGEMRRLTLAEMLVVGARVLLLDEISTGLDSAATYDISKSLRSLARVFNTTVVVALLQPPPETFEIFDTVCLMADGRIVYNAPRTKIEDHFKALGYARVIPTSTTERAMDLADFLIETSGSSPEDAERFSKAFQECALGLANAAELEQASQLLDENHPLEQDLLSAPRYKRSSGTLLKVVIARQWMVILRNRAFVKARIAQNLVMSLVLGALFFQVPFDEWYLVSMVLSQLLTFTGFATTALISDVVAVRNVYYKQNREAFFPAWTYVVGDYFVGLPFSFMDAALLGTITYFMAGLSHSNNGAPYFIFLVTMIAYSVCMACLVRMCAYMAPNSSSAFGLAVLLIVITLIFSGSIATPKVIPPWFIWIYWGFSPMAWAYRTVMQNEFLSKKYTEECASGCPNNELGQCLLSCTDPPCAPPYPNENCGNLFLTARQMQTDPVFLWTGIIAVLVYTVIFLLCSVLALTFLRHDDQDKGVLEIVRDSNAEKAAQEVADKAEKNAKVPLDPESQLPDEDKSGNPNMPEEVRELFKADGPSPALVFKEVRYSIEVPVKDDTDAVHGEGVGHSDGATRSRKRRRGPQTMPIDLLKNISGFAKPYEMTALMGSSGAGKTTLLDVLSFRKTVGNVDGDFTFGKNVPWTKDMSSQLGYIEQFGAHRGKMTVLESLRFSVNLRLPAHKNIPAVRDYLVQVVLDVLEMGPIASHLAEELSFEETKRLTIGVELVAWPRIVFADEPTSGLTSHEASITMRALGRVAALGKPVICTIHQPSYQIFSKFHRLLLLKRGGQVVFFGKLGEGACNLVEYFTPIPGVKPIAPGVNPASWMLDCIGAGVGTKGSELDFAEIYATSKLRHDNDQELAELEYSDESPADSAPSQANAESAALLEGDDGYVEDEDEGCATCCGAYKDKSATVYPTSYWEQFRLLFIRDFITIWRTPSYSYTRGIVMVFFALLTGLTFLQQKLTDAASTQSHVAVLTMMLILMGNYNANTIAPILAARRAAFYRERSSNMYAAWVYALATAFAEDPYLIVEVLVTIAIFYFLVGFGATASLFFYFTFLLFFFVEVVTFLAAFCVSLSSNASAGILVTILILQFASLFSGIFVPGNVMPTWLLFLYYLSPTRWAQEGLITTQFDYITDVICYPNANEVLTWTNGSEPRTCSEGPDGPAFYLSDVDVVARCCEPATAYPISARAYVLYGYTYPNGHVIAAWLGGNHGFTSKFQGYDYLYLIVFLVLLRFGFTMATTFISHQKR